jgi:cytochrome c oxidase subunit II
VDTSLLTRNFDRAFLWIGGVSLLLLAGITVAIVLFAVKYRRTHARTTSQRSGNFALEITWTVLPILLVIWMFYVGYAGFLTLRGVPDGAYPVRVTARRWSWSFDYPEAGIAGATELVVPRGRAVRVELTSPPDEVLHSFYLPDFREKEDVLPGRTTHLWFPAEREGTYDIFCAEFCGKGHSEMRAVLRIVPPKEFEAWLRKQAGRRLKPVDVATLLDPSKAVPAEEWSADASIVFRTFCASCHGEKGDGSGLPGEARNFTKTDGWKKGPRVTEIFRTLEKGIDGTAMRAFPNLSAWERVILAHHIRRFLGPAAPADTPEAAKDLVTEYGLDKIPAPRETIPVERAMEILERERK